MKLMIFFILFYQLLYLYRAGILGAPSVCPFVLITLILQTLFDIRLQVLYFKNFDLWAFVEVWHQWVALACLGRVRLRALAIRILHELLLQLKGWLCRLRVVFSLREHLTVKIVLNASLQFLFPKLNIVSANPIVSWISWIIWPLSQNLLDVKVHWIKNLSSKVPLASICMLVVKIHF